MVAARSNYSIVSIADMTVRVTSLWPHIVGSIS